MSTTYPGWKAIAAMARNRVIGRAGTLPWHLPEDLQWFKQCTLGQTVVMGRKTWLSLPRALPHRTNLVVSRTLAEAPGAIVVPDLESIDAAAPSGREIWLIGGAALYSEALRSPRLRQLFLTRLTENYEGDVYFPELDPSWHLAEILRTTPNFIIERYERTA